MISGLVIAKNEGRVIRDCFESLKWCDEIVLVDNGSTDDTLDIARKYGVEIVRDRSGRNYSDWRNRGLKEAKGDWILYLDADERIPPALREEIKGLLAKPRSVFSAFAIPRRNFIFGREFKHGGQWPDYQKRLFVRDKFEGWRGEVHEEPIFRGRLGHLKNPMIHLKDLTLSEMVEKTNWWSEIEARLMLDVGHSPMNIPRFLTAILREFWLRMIKQMAFLDGPKGIIYALYQVFSRFVSYAKLWEMQQK